MPSIAEGGHEPIPLLMTTHACRTGGVFLPCFSLSASITRKNPKCLASNSVDPYLAFA